MCTLTLYCSTEGSGLKGFHSDQPTQSCCAYSTSSGAAVPSDFIVVSRHHRFWSLAELSTFACNATALPVK